jgi:phosphate/sulfate permease
MLYALNFIKKIVLSIIFVPVLGHLVNVDLLYSLQQIILGVENKYEIRKMSPVMIPAFI